MESDWGLVKKKGLLDPPQERLAFEKRAGQLADELGKAKRMEEAKLAEINANAALDAERLRIEREKFDFEKLVKAADMKIKANKQQQQVFE